MKLNTKENINRYLEFIPKFGTSGREAARFDLEHFSRFCEAMGNPQHAFPAIHVGGTNGKGSTCQILASIYQQAGYKTGLYTSPHILSFTERFKINGEEISEHELVDFFKKYESLIRDFKLSYFELSTAIAFWYFAGQQVDLGIIEVGLGGRLDATNVIKPLVSVITNISLDHTDILGNTIWKIAREKAGIIKPEIPVVLGNVLPEAEAEITKIAAAKDSPVYTTGHLNPVFESGSFILHLNQGKSILGSDLLTPIQAFNIATAWQVKEVIATYFSVTERQFVRGVAGVRTIYPSLGRFEKLMDDRDWYFDGAHNVEAIQAMKGMVKTLRPVHESILVLSIMRDKLNKKVINEFSEFKKIFYHELNSSRAASLDSIRQCLPGIHPFPATTKKRNLIFKEFKTELVIFAGSFYFYETVRDWLASFIDSR